MKWTSEFPKESGAYWYRDSETEPEVRLFFQGRAVWHAGKREFIFWPACHTKLSLVISLYKSHKR